MNRGRRLRYSDPGIRTGDNGDHRGLGGRAGRDGRVRRVVGVALLDAEASAESHAEGDEKEQDTQEDCRRW